MLQKTGILILLFAMLCLGSCRQEEPVLLNCSYVSYDSFENFQEDIRVCKQKKANETLMLREEVFWAALTEYIYRQPVPISSYDVYQGYEVVLALCV